MAGDKLKTVCTYSLSFPNSVGTFGKDCHQRVVASGFFIAYLLQHPYSTRKQSICMDGLEENTALFTPESKRRPALIERLVKHKIHRWKQGLVYKRINPSWALGGFCVSKTLERAGIPLYSTLGELWTKGK